MKIAIRRPTEPTLTAMAIHPHSAWFRPGGLQYEADFVLEYCRDEKTYLQSPIKHTFSTTESLLLIL